jgi:hypothetical protein
MTEEDDVEKCQLAFPIALRVALPHCATAEEAARALAPFYGVPSEMIYGDIEAIVRAKFYDSHDVKAILRWVICRAVLQSKRENKDLGEMLIQAWTEVVDEYRKRFGRSL